MAASLPLVLAALLGLVTLGLLLLVRSFSYWRRKNVPYINPYAPLSLLAAACGVKPFPWNQPQWKRLSELYFKYKDNKYAGYFDGLKPVLVVTDPDLIKFVLTKQFASFQDKGFYCDEENDPLSANLLNLAGERWKFIRTRLSPTFSSGKLKLMFPLMTDISKELVAMLKQESSKGKELDFKSLLTRYTTDIIGSCAFGVTCNSLKDPESEFYVMGQKAIRNFKKVLVYRVLLASVSPVLAKLLSFKNMFATEQNFFVDLMKETVDFRRRNSVERNDFVKLMMQLRDVDPNNAGGKDFSATVMAAQAFLFFVAGLDNVAFTICFCLHELSFDPELQARAAKEVRDQMRAHGGELTYDAVRAMHLLDRILSEALRKYSPLSFLRRVVTVPSIRIPGSDVILDTSSVYIPLAQLHHDPAYYPDPERFDPDRFTEEAVAARHPYVYMPFGQGPRVCIAERFARLEMLLCLATLLNEFHFSPSLGAQRELQLREDCLTPKPKHGFAFRLEERTQ